MEIALSAAAGVVTTSLAVLAGQLRAREMPGLKVIVFALPAAAAIGFFVYETIHHGPLPLGARLGHQGVFLALGVTGLIGSARMLAIYWHDEDTLADMYGSNEGYIPRPQLVPVRVKWILSLVLFAGVVAAMAAHFIYALGAGE
ncbi:MAG: hypothetical protein JO276_14145 [Sphingomonadaceae bacterium]|nr:hypothetical protein [Sphingomonadaceae bacterium]